MFLHICPIWYFRYNKETNIAIILLFHVHHPSTSLSERNQAQDDIRANVVTNDNNTLVCDFSLVYRNWDDCDDDDDEDDNDECQDDCEVYQVFGTDIES